MLFKTNSQSNQTCVYHKTKFDVKMLKSIYTRICLVNQTIKVDIFNIGEFLSECVKDRLNPDIPTRVNNVYASNNGTV